MPPAVLSIEGDEVNPARVIKHPVRMQPQRLFSDPLFGSADIVMIRLPLDEGLQQSGFPLAVDQRLGNLAPYFFLDFSEVGLYT